MAKMQIAPDPHDLQHWLDPASRPAQDAAPVTFWIDDDTRWRGPALVMTPELFCKCRAASYVILQSKRNPEGLVCKLDEWKQHGEEIWCYLKVKNIAKPE